MKIIILKKLGDNEFGSKDQILQAWKSKRFKHFIIIKDETELFDDYERINGEIFHQKTVNFKDFIKIKVILDNGYYIINHSDYRKYIASQIKNKFVMNCEYHNRLKMDNI